mmetsp:Transcript_10212/g.16762  ORF Transcript_10212/g.16762 Transcript_10212/m.16762 type:complete len:265 (-) Transcript_10212:341-1135(-)
MLRKLCQKNFSPKGSVQKIAHRLSPNMISAQRLVFFSSTSDARPPGPPPSIDDEYLNPGEKLLYRETQQFTVRMMLGVSGVNFLYWGSQIANCIFYRGIVIEGIDLGGDPTWAMVGSFATGLFVFFSRSYAHHSVFQCYESQDGERLGFQMHTILGRPGRKIEVGLGKARFISPPTALLEGKEIAEEKANQSVVSSLLKTSMIPVSIDGFEGNALFDEGGKYYDKHRLVELLSKPINEIRGVDEKDSRTAWKKQVSKSRKKGRK